MLGISRMGLYKAEKRQQELIVQARVLTGEVRKIREEQPRIGTKKLLVLLQPVLLRHNIKIGRDGLFDLLREFGLLVKTRRFRHYCTNSKHEWYKYPNQTKDMELTKANQLWVSDITYIEVARKFYYLSLVSDAYSRKIVGHCLSDNYSVQGTIKAFKKAQKDNHIPAGLIHHSDRGVQYCCREYTSLLKNKKITISMTQNSDPYENAKAERINGILKTELLQKSYTDEITAQKAIDKAISIYNNKRPHLSISMLTPAIAHQYKGELRQLWTKKQYLQNKI